LSRVSFGFPDSPGPLPERLSPGQTHHGVFHQGRLVGQAFDLHDRQWWGGRTVEAADLGAVAVLPEARGHGIARTLVTTLLAHARERGAVVSALFPSISSMYQGFGWATVGSVTSVDLPTATLRSWPLPADHAVRPGTEADLAAVHQLYVRVAAARNGMLTREEERSRERAGEFPHDVDGLTVVERDGVLVGYCTWSRGSGFRSQAVLTVREVLAVTADAARALVSMLHSWGMVTPTLRVTPLGTDAVATSLPLELGQVHRVKPWMHRPVDIAGAVAERGWPAHVRGHAVFSLTDKLAPWNTGTWALDIDDGAAELRRTTSTAPVELTVNGFALLYSGVANSAALRQAGLLDGPSDAAAALDVLSVSPPPCLLDSF
jgi:predicted acetyltransferase